MRPSTVQLLLAAAVGAGVGCVQPAATRCDDGTWCPSYTQCAPADHGSGHTCVVAPDECGRFPDGTPCAAPERSECVEGHCTLWVGCGDGIVQAGEACDEAGGNSDLVPGACRVDCSQPRCGDGIRDPGEAPYCLGAPTAYPTGVDPDRLLAADLDGDGRVDAVTGNLSTRDVSVLLGVEDGGFVPVDGLAVGGTPGVIAAGRLDGDEHVDLVIPDVTNARLLFLSGHGDGTFADARSIDMGASVWAAAAADLDGDSMDDVVAVGPGVGIAVLWGAVGGPTETVLFPVDGSAVHVALGDLDGDGRLDVAVADTAHHQVIVRLGDPVHVLGPPASWGTGTSPGHVMIRELTGDGIADVVTANLGSGDLSLLPGVGLGALGARETLPTGAATHAVTAGDVNGDRRTDLLAATLGEALALFVAAPEGGFDPARSFPTGGNVGGVALAHLDGDSRLDVIATHSGVDALVVMRGGDGSIGTRRVLDASALDDPQGLAVADFDGDGAEDIAIANLADGKAFLLSGLGQGLFAPAVEVGAIDATWQPEELVAADLDGDGRSELVVALATGPGPVMILEATDPPGDLRERVTLDPGIPPMCSRVAVGHLDRDGRPDVACGSSTYGSLTVWLGGSGGFSDPIDVPLGEGAGEFVNVERARLADLDLDGADDLVVTTTSGRTLYVLRGRGDGTFDPPAGPEAIVPDAGRRMGVADLDEDGLPDLVVAYDESNRLTLLYGAGDCTFRDRRTVTGLLDPRGVGVGDLNGDGHADVVVAEADRPLLSVFLGQGDGTLASPQGFESGTSPTSVALGDLDGDGRPDVIVADNMDDEVTIYLAP